MFSLRPSFFATAWYDSTSKPTGVFGSLGWKNSIGEYSTSTQFDSSPAFSNDVGAVIGLAAALGLAAGLAASLAAAEAEAAAALGAVDAAVPPPVVHAETISPAAVAHDSRCLRRPITVSSSDPAASPLPRRRAHLYHGCLTRKVL